MPPELTQYDKAVLDYLAENKYGKRRSDKIFDEFTTSTLRRQHIKSILKGLERTGYIKLIEIDKQAVKFLEEMTDEPVSNVGYRITPLGKGILGDRPTNVTSYSNISNSAISHHSPGSNQSIKITEQSEDIQRKFAELQDAVSRRDSSAMKKAFGYIADKSVDVAIAIAAGALLR